MKAKGPGLWRPLAFFAGAAVALLAFASQTPGAEADSENRENIQRTAAEIEGEATGGGAVSGPAVTFGGAQVHQLNIRVNASSQETQDNSTQTATNEANVTQTDVAVAGDATSSDGSDANSGAAVAGSVAIVHQMNIQVIAGPGSCQVTQEASNVANVDQTAVAASGDADASGDSSASSGDAMATNSARVHQRNLQVYVCRNDSTGEQVANNVGGLEQTTLAATGSSTATDGSTATTGDASGSADSDLVQQTRQMTLD